MPRNSLLSPIACGSFIAVAITSPRLMSSTSKALRIWVQPARNSCATTAEPDIRGLELADYDSNERESHIHLERRDQGRNASRQYHLSQDLALGGAESLCQLDLVGIDALEAIVDHENGDEERDRERHAVD